MATTKIPQELLEKTSITFADNEKLNFGTSNDLQIYHDSSIGHSVITDVGTGNLLIRGTNLNLQDSAGYNYIVMEDTGNGGVVKLRHNDVTKLETASGGITVTGTVTSTTGFTTAANTRVQASSGMLFLNGPSAIPFEIGAGSEKMRLTSTGLGIGTTSPAHPLHVYGDGGYYLSFDRGNSTPGGPDPWLGLFNNVLINNATYGWGFYDSNSDGSLQLWNKNNSTTGYNVITFKRGGNVGIGTTSPTEELTVGNGGSNYIGIGGDGLNSSGLRFYRGASTVDGLIEVDSAESMILSIDNTGALGTGTIKFKTGNAERMRVTSSGDVGIGTSAPNSYTNQKVLTINGTTHSRIDFETGGTLRGSVYGDSGSLNIDAGGNYLRFYTGNTEKMRIDSSGKVGIGTTSPSHQLTLSGANAEFSISRTGSYADTITMGMPSGVPTIVGGTDLAFGGTGSWTEHMRIKADGKVGIGTASPVHKLDVRDGTIFAGRLVSDEGSISYTNTAAAFSSRGVDHDAARSNVLRLLRDGTSGVQYAGVADFDLESWETSGVHSRTAMILKLGHGNLPDTPEVMTWRSNGNVGIGTTAPAYPLDVVGNVRSSTGVYLNNSSGGFLWNQANSHIAFGTNNTERVRIGAGGAIDIANNQLGWYSNTDSAWMDGTMRFSNLNFKNAGGTTRMYIAGSTGKVGIGIGSGAVSRLHVRAPQSDTMTAANAFAAFDGTGGDGIIIGARASSPFGAYIQSGYTPNIGTSHHYPLLLNPHGGNVGIGTDTPDAKLELMATRSSGANATALILHDNVTGVQTTGFGTRIEGRSNNNNAVSAISFEAYGGTNNDTAISFYTQPTAGGLARRMIINDDGYVGIGTATPSNKITVQETSGSVVAVQIMNDVSTANSSVQPLIQCQFNGDASLGTGTPFIKFANQNDFIGSITGAPSATAYNTSSDYRLKENVDYSWDATTRLKQLKPARFNFISDETNTLIDGFLAHEVSSVVPNAVIGEKDEVDTDGKAVMQGIDHSKLVPLLVKTIQELEARIETLENK